MTVNTHERAGAKLLSSARALATLPFAAYMASAADMNREIKANKLRNSDERKRK